MALNIEAGAEDHGFEGNSIMTLFGIEILLTEKGYANLEIVIEAIFSALLMLKNASIEDHRRIHNELKTIHDTHFDYSEEKTSGDNTETYAVNMKYYESVDIISGADKIADFDGEIVKKLIEKLNEGKFNLILLTDKHSHYPKIEKWFGTEYDEIGKNIFFTIYSKCNKIFI